MIDPTPQTYLVYLKIGIWRDDSSTGEVDTLAREVATKPSCLALESLNEPPGGLLWL